MKAPRNVPLTVGKRTYTIKTPLDDAALSRVQALLRDACGDPARGTGQEELMLLACLKLAYSLDTLTERLEVLADRLSDAEGLRKAPSASGASGRAADEGEEASEEDRKSGFPAPR